MKITIGKKMGMITTVMAVFGLCPMMLVGYMGYMRAHNALEEQAYEKMTAIREMKKVQLQDFVAELERDLTFLANDPYLQEAFRNLNQAAMSDAAGVHGPFWQEKLKPYEARLRQVEEMHGWEDFYLINPAGMIIYSAEMAADFGQTIPGSSLRNEGIGKAFRVAKENNETALADFEPYSPDKGMPASFMVTPFSNQGGAPMGYLALKVPIDHIDEIMHSKEGLGQTGEMFVVGPDHLMRSNLYSDQERYSVKASFANPTIGRLDTELVTKALAGETGVHEASNHSNVHVYGAFTPVKLGNLTWALVVQINETEADMPAKVLRSKILNLGIVVFLLVVGAILVVFYVSRGLSQMLRHVICELSGSSEQLAAAAEQISASSQQLSEGATQQAASLEETSSSMEQMSGQTKENAGSCIKAAEEVVEVSDMVRGSAKKAREASDLSKEARKRAENGVEAMGEIAQSMKKIRLGSEKVTAIIEVIGDITHQTKMLATNAAIEAARAGDQGKGFAVVADEVSKLAEHSKNAAKEIAGLIKESARNAEDGNALADKGEHALRSILEKFDQVAGLVMDIASNAEAQAGKVGHMQELLENIKNATSDQAAGVEEINRSLIDLDKVTQSNAATAEEAASSSEELTGQAQMLKDMVSALSQHVGLNGSATMRISGGRSGYDGHRGASENGQRAYSRVYRLKSGDGHVRPADVIPMRDDFKEFQ